MPKWHHCPIDQIFRLSGQFVVLPGILYMHQMGNQQRKRLIWLGAGCMMGPHNYSISQRCFKGMANILEEHSYKNMHQLPMLLFLENIIQ
jgi:hypothetical protein